MTKPLRELLEEEKEEEEAAAAQTSPPAPANSPASSDVGSPRSDPSMKLSSSSADDSASFDQKLKEIAEKKRAEEDAHSSKTEGQTPASSYLGSPGSDPSMKLSSFSADDSVSFHSFDLKKLKEIAKKKTAEEDSHSSKTEGQTSAGESSKSGEGSGTSEKIEVSDLAEKASSSPAKVKKSVTLQRSDEALDNVLKQTTSLLTSVKSVPSSELHAIMIESSNESSKAMVEEAWERLKKAFVYFGGKPVGSLAAMDPTAEDLNYNQVFVRDFVPTGLACLMKNPAEPEIVRNFLLKTLHLQGRKKMVDNFTLGEGVLPASFKVSYDPRCHKESIVADFGGSAIGRVAPVDSGFWWIILLRAYTKCTHDFALAELPEVQNGIKLILKLCLSDGFDTFPTLLCADGCSMIDRRMGIYGYPVEIQALFYFALRCAKQLLKPEGGGEEFLERIDKRITALRFHIQKYYWLDFTQLNNIYRYKTEEYSHTAVNKFNVMPESIPDWVFDFMPLQGGYLIGNVSPARMDFRWFLVGNCIAILCCLTTPAQAQAIMDLIEERWEDLIGEMPLKIAYPALEGHEWRIVTGFDSKNSRWSYHNGGSWPTLLWLLSAACSKTGRIHIARRAIELAEQRLSKDGWPEYYDGKTGRYIGKQARKYQTWSISGYLVAKMMIEDPFTLPLVSLEEDKKISKSMLTRSVSI